MAGIGTRKLKIEVDGNEYADAVSNARFTTGAGDADFLTFAAADAGGNREYRLQGTAVQDAETDSLWDYIWSHLGESVDVVLMPYGNATPSVSQPHFTATATIAEDDGDLLGGDANVSKSARFTVSINWVLDAKPVKVTT